MEGRGCRREVPGLTLVLFLGQKKASSGRAAAMLEKNLVQPVRVRVLGGPPAGSRPGSRGPFTNACRRARSPVRPHHHSQ